MKDAILYAIGDVHGRSDHLSKTLQFIEADARYWGGRPVVYFLGDIVDRGTDSKGALELVHETLKKHEGSRLHLGNHDNWFLDAIQTGGKGNEVGDWLDQGGQATLDSFYPGVHFVDAISMISQNHAHLVRMVSNSHLITMHGRMVFCHAGVDRFSDLDDQHVDVLTWIRSPFLEISDATMPVVVHGHTIFKHGPVVTDNRISLDTGCYASNRLSTLRVDPKRRKLDFIVSSDSGRMVEVDEIEPHILERGCGTALDRLDEIFDEWKD